MMNNANVASSLEFFKIFLPDSSSQHMIIPPAFVKYLNGTFPNKATIKDHMGKSWCGTLEKLDGRVYFKNGWKAFVDYHFLNYGDFLIFQYDGHSTFDVKIFGKNGCKKAVVAEAADSVPIVEAVVAEATHSIPVAEDVVSEAAHSVPIVEAVVAEATHSVPVAEDVVSEAAHSVPIVEAVVAEATHSVPVAEDVVADAAHSVPIVEAVVAEAAHSVPIVEAVVAEATHSVPVAEDVVADVAHSVPIVEAVVAEAAHSVPIVEAVIAEAAHSVPIVEAVVAEADHSVPIVVAETGNSVPILKVKEEPMVEKEDVEHSIPSKRKQIQVGSKTVSKRSSIGAPNCGRHRNASNYVERVGQRGPFFERTMKPSSSKTIYIPGWVVSDQNISLKPNLVLRDEKGKLWPTSICCTSQNRISVTAGWSKFYKDHKLKIDDKCQFEFVLERGNVCRQLNVKVLRHSR